MQCIPQKTLTSSREVDECKPLLGEIAMQASTSAATMDEQSTILDEGEAFLRVRPRRYCPPRHGVLYNQ
jgi:hypothetical protein